MLTSTLKVRLAKASAGIAALAMVAGGSVLGGNAAGADPKQFPAFQTVGSDTTQDLLNGYAGFNNNINYVPIQSPLGGLRQFSSWDATGSTCITTKAGVTPAGPTFVRPNGSTNGRRALSRAVDGAVWPAPTTNCGGPKVITGQVEVARSSAGPASAGTDLIYFPVGRDALTFAYYRQGGGATVNTFTTAQLNAFFTTAGPHFADSPTNSIPLVACGVQTGAGTYQSWNSMLGMNSTTEPVGTATCNAAGSGARIQENDGAGLFAKGNAQPGVQVIATFSVANFVAQTNGVVASQLPAPAGTIRLGATNAIDPYSPYGVGAPTPPLTPNPAYYSTSFGRDVYNVVSRLRIFGLGSTDFKSMFVVGTIPPPSTDPATYNSPLCSGAAVTTRSSFGFLASVQACGTTTTQGPLVANV